MSNKLQELTDITLNEVKKLEIVLPEIYKDIFYTKAYELNIKIDKKDKEEALLYALKKISTLKDETEKSASNLQKHINEALEAIEEKDDETLTHISMEVSKLQQKIKILQNTLYTDELTNIHNRRWLYEKYLDNNNFVSNGVLAFLDIDNFKYINDSFGHITGDKVLALIGTLLKKVDNSFSIRFAGDEFILISEHFTKNELSKLLQRVRKNLSSRNLKHEDQLFNVTFSFGVTDFKRGDDFNKILKSSDQLMYHHKKLAEIKI